MSWTLWSPVAFAVGFVVGRETDSLLGAVVVTAAVAAVLGVLDVVGPIAMRQFRRVRGG